MGKELLGVFKFIFFWSLVCLTPSTYTLIAATPLSVAVTAQSAILINAETGAVLFEKNADKEAYPASITKIATALYALKMKGNSLQEEVTAKQEALASISPQAKRQSNYRSPPHWLESDASHIGIRKGEIFTLENLMYAMLVSSANDAANVIAQHVGGTIPQFMEALNSYLKELGCKNTHFVNPHGLHHPNHKTTAYDMSLIAKECMKDPIFRKIVSTARFTLEETNLQPARNLIQTNLLLRKGPKSYAKAIGVKTGYTSAAGKTLVAAAEDKDNQRIVISVVMDYPESSKDRYDDTKALFEAAFNQQKLRKRFLNQGEQSLSMKVSGGKNLLKTYLKEDLVWDYYPAEEITVQAKVNWSVPAIPIEKDQVVGSVVIVDANQKILVQKPLYASMNVKPTLLYAAKKQLNFKEHIFIKVVVLIVISAVGVFFIKRAKIRHF